MTWEVVFSEQIAEWVSELDLFTRTEVYSSIRLLEEFGPQLDRPYVGKIAGSKLKNMKELRPLSNSRRNLCKIQGEPMSEKLKFYTWAEILEKYPPSEDANTRWELDRAIYIAGQNLKQVRKKRNVTQTALAALLKVSQNRISQIERGKLDAAQLGTLERYVAALGGELTVSAKFGNETYVLSNNGETSK